MCQENPDVFRENPCPAPLGGLHGVGVDLDSLGKNKVGPFALAVAGHWHYQAPRSTSK